MVQLLPARAAVSSGAVITAALLAATACGLPTDPVAAKPPRTPGVHAAHRHQAPTCAERVFDGLGLAQRVGQLFVVGVRATGPTRQETRVVASRHVGGVVLMGHSDVGVERTRTITRRLQRNAASGAARLWIAADQEGGQVQRLRGPGFSRMPEALAQGRMELPTLRDRARRWGRQLARAGVNLDLAPVMDTVPAELGEGNAPIGRYHRELGHRPVVVSHHGTAFLDGMRAAGVAATVKHFPGLGRVRRNTDTSRQVVDDVTTRTDAYLRPFRAAISDRVPVVMVSSAIYSRIDAHRPGPFSRRIVTGMLQHDLGFHGVVMSDDLAAAKALSRVPVGRRAVRFLRAGGSVALGVDASTMTSMIDAVLHRARTHQSFRERVASEALKVLRAKQSAGLLRCRA